MVKNILYGTEDNQNFFVQTSCGEEHLGQDCDCKSYGIYRNEAIAKYKTKEIGDIFKVPVVRI